MNESTGDEKDYTENITVSRGYFREKWPQNVETKEVHDSLLHVHFLQLSPQYEEGYRLVSREKLKYT